MKLLRRITKLPHPRPCQNLPRVLPVSPAFLPETYIAADGRTQKRLCVIFKVKLNLEVQIESQDFLHGFPEVNVLENQQLPLVILTLTGLFYYVGELF